MARKTYTEEQITALLEYAQEVGLSRAVRDLGYPDSISTADRWAKLRGVSLEVDPVKQRAARTNHWYQDEEKLVVAQAGLERVLQALSEDALVPDDIKKLADAYKRYVETMLLIQGKATSITQTTEGDDVFAKMLEDFNKRNQDVAQRGLSEGEGG